MMNTEKITNVESSYGQVPCIVCGQLAYGPLTGSWVFCTRCSCLLAWSDKDTEAFVRLGMGLDLCWDFTNSLSEPVELPVPPGIYV